MHATAADTAASIPLRADPAAQVALQVVAQLRAAGHAAFWVGGCVRDLVLGLTPKDYDIATSAKPGQVKQIFSSVIEVGVAFGVVRVRLADHAGWFHEVEVATFRADGAYFDGRRPSGVRFTDAKEDVLRRDFTINGLLLDPLARPGEGDVVDWVGGLVDLRQGNLRAIGDPAARFAEDALRLLRAARFAARFHMAVEPATASAIRAAAPTLHKVSVERITQEITLMLRSATPAAGIAHMVELGLAAVLWPERLAADPGLVQAQRVLKQVRAAGVGPTGEWPSTDLHSLALNLAALADGDAQWLESLEFLASFRLSREDLSAVRQTAALYGRPPLGEARPPPWSALEARWLREPQADAALLLLAARASGSPGPADWTAWRRLRALWPQTAAFPTLPFNGDTFLAWGCPAGPAFKQALAAAHDVVLSGGSAASALAVARAELAAAGLLKPS